MMPDRATASRSLHGDVECHGSAETNLCRNGDVVAGAGQPLERVHGLET